MLDLRLVVDESASGYGPVKIKCLVHDDPTASMCIYPDNIHCFGCGYHRNDWDECLALLLGISKDAAHEVAPRYSTESLDAYRTKAAQQARRDPLPKARALMYNRYLRDVMSHRLDWLYKRGLTDETIDRELLGHDGFRFSIPVYDFEGRLVTIRFRRDDTILPEFHEDENGRPVPVPKYSGLKGRNGLYLYGEHWLSQFPQHWVIVTEGELDALRLRQQGLPAVSATNGARQTGAVIRLLLDVLPDLRSLYIATDQDEPGEEAAVQAAKAASAFSVEATRLMWMEGKDITEHLQMRGKLDVMKGVWNGEKFDWTGKNQCR
jgi:DNA primase